MSFKKILQDNFPAISDEQWKSQVLSDLKGKSIEETLVWEDENKLKHQPYYRSSDLKKLNNLSSLQAVQKKTSNWEILSEAISSIDPVEEFITKRSWNPELIDFESKDFAFDFSVYGKMGGTAIQELSFALSQLTEYLDYFSKQTKVLAGFFMQLKFKLSIEKKYFSEIAKIRAFRLCIDRLLSQYNLAFKYEIVAELNEMELAHKDAHTNLLRTTSMCMSAVLGGADKVFVPAYNQLEEPSDFGKRMAVNIQRILKEESHFDKVTDAASGSYYIETLSHDMADQAWKEFIQIEESGGFSKNISSGYINEELSRSKNNKIDRIKSGDEVVVGVNKYKNEEGIDLHSAKNCFAKEADL